MLPIRTADAPSPNLWLSFSWNTIHASKIVNTISKFNRSDALAAGMCGNPSSKSTGATIPPKTVVHASQGVSILVIELSLGIRLFGIMMANRIVPMPEPR
jgi:hypothetical protein